MIEPLSEWLPHHIATYYEQLIGYTGCDWTFPW
jgi:hypothetical protein